MPVAAFTGASADVRVLRREQRRRDNTLLVLTLVSTVVLGAIAFVNATRPFPLALLGLVVVGAIAISRPVLGTHALIFLTIFGDSATAAWWPFTKNLSSRESILFVADEISVTPFELVLVLLFVACLSPAVTTHRWRLHGGVLNRPMLVVSVFIVAGLVRGMGGGDRNVALFEVRPLLYLVAVYFLVVNVFTSRAHYRQAVWVAMIATVGQSLLSINYYWGLSAIRREQLESLAEHSATIQMNALFIFALGLVMFKGSTLLRRLMVVLAIPVVYAFLLSQRRAAMVALFAGAFLLFVVLYQRRRRTFWSVAPVVLVFTLGYVVATWNATGAAGLPASAVKSVLFPGQLSAADQQSDLYRDLEAINVWYTIRANALAGQGFGRPFLIVAPMPSISFFEFWQYLPHNSILWLWIKMGVLGFVAMMYTIGRAVLDGARALLAVASPHDLAVVLVGIGYVVMFTIFAYVDIAFSARPTVFLGLCLAICCDFVRVPADVDRSATAAGLPVSVPVNS